MNQFIYYSGFVVWSLVLLAILLRIIFGKSWLLKSGLTLFIGPRLLSASKKLANELPDKVKRETLAEVGTYAFLRLVNIGIITLLLAIIPIWLLFNQNTLLSRQNDKMDEQNEKLDVQNERLNLQNNLLEADRRGSLIFLMSNVLDQMNEEINGLKDEGETKYDRGYVLSDPLIGRIAALSQGFRPYRFLQGDTLIAKATSPERGQLFLALVKSNLASGTYKKIYKASNFEFAYLRGANLRKTQLSHAQLNQADLIGANLREANLSHAQFNQADLIGANLREAYLRGANLIEANLSQAKLFRVSFRNADLSGANLSDAYLSKAYLRSVNLSGADLRGANLIEAYLRGAILSRTQLSHAQLHEADLSQAKLNRANLSQAKLFRADFSEADFSNVHYLTIDQCKQAWRLWECKGLDTTLKKQLVREMPCLFTEEGCEENKPVR